MFFWLDSQLITIYRRLLRYVRPHAPVIVAAVIAMLIYSAANACVPLIMREVIGTLEESGRSGSRVVVPLMLAGVFLVRGTTDFVAVFGLSWVGRSVVREVRAEIFRHYTELPARFFDRISSGELISKLTYNTEQLAEALSSVIVTVFRDSITILVLIGVMIYLSPPLSLLVFVVAPIVAFLVLLMSKAFRRYSIRIQASMGDATRVTEEALRGQRIVKIFEGQLYEQRQFDEVNKRNFGLNLKLIATRAVGDSLTQCVLALGVAAIIWIAFSEEMMQALNAALFMAFLTAMGMLLAPLKRLININVVLQRGIAAGHSLFETLDEPVESDIGKKSLVQARGVLEFRKVSFTYDYSKGQVLKDLSFSISSGQSLAIVGRSGSGKSTLVSLLPRFYDVEAGNILLDGEDIRQYQLRDLRRQISLVSQDVILFNDSIANNIAYGSLANSSQEQLEKAAEAAYVMEFTSELPDGLETQVGDRGLLLSGGQRQRIAIARALLKDAPILILDEATSSLDTESERRIQRALGQLMKGRTTLVIAHRLSTVETADCIMVLRDGKIVETGNHAELVAYDGYYKALYRMQFAEQ